MISVCQSLVGKKIVFQSSELMTKRDRTFATKEIVETEKPLPVLERLNGYLPALGCILIPIVYLSVVALSLWVLVGLVKFFWTHS